MAIGLVFALGVFGLGASVGSFLNVAIYRLPAGLSVVRPASRCPACATPIRWHHNVPIFGWLLVRGRCAACGTPISVRYALVELATGLLALALFHDLAGGPVTLDTLASERFVADVVGPFVLYFAFAAALVAVAFIDLDWFVIPDAISLPLVPLGVATAAVFGHAVGVTWVESLAGAAAGAGVLVVVILVYGALTGREGMGGGDWKLLAAIGAWLGWEALPLVLLGASLQGILLTLLLGRRFAVESLPDLPLPASGPEPAPPPPPPPPEDADLDPAAAKALPDEPPPPGLVPEAPRFGQLAIPFGPFLALAALEVLVFRTEIRAVAGRWLSMGLSLD